MVLCHHKLPEQHPTHRLDPVKLCIGSINTILTKRYSFSCCFSQLLQLGSDLVIGNAAEYKLFSKPMCPANRGRVIQEENSPIRIENSLKE